MNMVSSNMTKNLVIGGVTYVATANDWSANFFGDVNGTAGVPFQAFLGGAIGQLSYDILFSGSQTWVIGPKITRSIYTGLGAMVGAVAATIVGGSASAPVGAALGSIYFDFDGSKAGGSVY